MEACDWTGHEAAMDEAGWCPVCDRGVLDDEFAERNGIEPFTEAEKAEAWQEMMEEADAQFDGGEFSRDAHARRQAR